MKTQTYSVFGPFELVLVAGPTGTRESRKKSRREVKRLVEELYPEQPKLLKKPGCYIFALRTGGKGRLGGAFKVWYVGKSKRPLYTESLTERNCDMYRSIVDGQHGSPVLFWIAKAAPGHGSSSDKRDVEDMETALIYAASDQNHSLCNDMKNPRKYKFQIAGVPLVGQHDLRRASKGPAAQIAKMLGL